MNPVYDWIAHHARYSPDAVALIDTRSERTLSYRRLNDRCSRAAAYLTDALGVAPGNRVAVLCHNSSDVLELLFACQKTGAIFVPLNWRLAAPELRFILEDCRPVVLVYGDEFEAVAAALADEITIPHRVSVSDGQDSDYERGLDAAAPQARLHPQGHDDTWINMYTSGTTGVPKGVRITHGNVFFSAVNASMKFRLSARSRCLTFLPLFHVGGLFLFATFVLHQGGSAVIVRHFDPERCLAWLADREAGISHVFGVPTNFLFMSQLPAFADADLRHLRGVAIGGAAAPLELLRAYAHKEVRIQQCWGMTETATIGTVLSEDRCFDKLGSSGLPVLHASMRIVDPEGKEVAPGEVGELWVKGPTVTPGYWNRPDANETSFTDGWFHTGDAVRTDEEGYFYVVDRWKDMFISGGENVYPAEVENVLYRLPQVAEAAVVGVPDERWGEVGCAFVVRRAGQALDAEAVAKHCRQNLGGFKVPKRFVFLDELPHSAAGKITKADLRRLYRERLAKA